jgi:4-amino-4-deoxy-L-arabinose transferase-like glycosyltransferase
MIRIVKKYLNLNPWIIFFPFFLLFVIIILKLATNQFQGDEKRYYDFANNIINGFYSPASPNINLWNGPGYPLFLVPFVYFETPLIVIKLANALLQYISIILVFKAINKYVNRLYAVIFSFAWALYYISYQELFSILSEPLTSFLASLIIYLLTLDCDKNKDKIRIYLTGVVLGFLALTKIIFGYVIICMFSLSLLIYFINGKKINAGKSIFILATALILNIQYLLYTYNLTGKILYWGNSGGSSLYWMSTPVEGEFGDWNNAEFTANCGHDIKIPCNANLIAKNHQKNMDQVNKLPLIEQDDELKKIAINNIINNPIKYLRNCISNFSRLFFGIPSSYFYQREITIWRIIPNSIVLTLLFLSCLLSLINYKEIKFEIRFIICLSLTYMLLTIFVSAYPRQLYVIMPILLFWNSYVFNKFIIFRCRNNVQNE